jgi:glycosyltransferase involved in cell wall biosynthesis
MGRAVSVVVPTYNYAAFLPRCIESVLSQSLKPLEIIVVDDGSTDNTETVVSRYNGVTYVRQDNAGVSRARNHGLALARGDYIQFLDADDWLAPNKLSLCVAHLSKHPVTTPFTRMAHAFDRPLDAVRFRTRRLAQRLLGHPRSSWKPQAPLDSLLTVEIGVMSPLYAREALQNAGGFDERLYMLEDIEINLRLALAGYKFEPVGRVGATCRHHRSPSRGRANPKKLEGELDALRTMLHRVRESAGGLTPALAQIFAYRFANLAARGGTGADAALKQAYAIDPAPRFSLSPLLHLLRRQACPE